MNEAVGPDNIPIEMWKCLGDDGIEMPSKWRMIVSLGSECIKALLSAEEVWRAAPWTMLFADDIVIVCKIKAELRKRLSRWKRALEEKGFTISRTKTEYLQPNDFEDLDDMRMDEEIIKKIPAFKYLGTHVTEDGELDVEINHQIQCGWNSRRKLLGVLCDKKMVEEAAEEGEAVNTAVHFRNMGQHEQMIDPQLLQTREAVAANCLADEESEEARRSRYTNDMFLRVQDIAISRFEL
eukprot:gene14763-5870_t